MNYSIPYYKDKNVNGYNSSFWGLPLWPSALGRAIAQLAARSALQRFQRFGLPPSAALLQPLSLRRLLTAKQPIKVCILYLTRNFYQRMADKLIS
ncbi:hypothetical protein [Saprospira grandis]|uniref:hypothetical protein n=1 Tax=Saprospira grandis TaxID=1008 RepID=UPI0022DE5BDA|nr:hypothetical protein [Saprospira grandis]WBM74054.1 hypothetical protein OP864_13785 [Saprospira grandis]